MTPPAPGTPPAATATAATATADPPTATGKGWSRLSVASRSAILGLVAIVAVVAFGKFVGRATEAADDFGPQGSSKSTAGNGTAALRELLGRYGVVTREQVGEIQLGELDPSTTLVVLDPFDMPDHAVRALSVFVGNGGRLVAGGSNPTWIARIVGDLPRWDGETLPPARAMIDDGQFTIRADTGGSWVVPPSLLVRRTAGDGEVRAVANSSPLQNQLLGEADNAAFAVSLIGTDRTVVFAEGVHGFGRRTGLAAIPSRWKAALLLGSLSALLTALAVSRRLGPPEHIARPLPPPRAAYVDAIAEVLRRSKQPRASFAAMQDGLRSRVATQAGLAPWPTDMVAATDGTRVGRHPPERHGPDPTQLAALIEAAQRMGWSVDDIAALRDPVTDDAGVLRLGHALAKTR